MSKNEKQEYETFESLIKKTIIEINKSLYDTDWSIDVDIKAGGIKIINKDGCSYTNAIGLSERELLDILAGMDLVLTFKEGEKEEKQS